MTGSLTGVICTITVINCVKVCCLSYVCRQTETYAVTKSRNGIHESLRQCRKLKCAIGINSVDRILQHIPIQIGVPTRKPQRIRGGPASNDRIVVARPEVHQPAVRIVQPAGKAERLETRIGVARDIAPDVVGELPSRSAPPLRLELINGPS